MGITSIGDRKTPSVPIELVLDPETGLPTANQEVLLVGRAASSTPASARGVVINIANSADDVLAGAEMLANFPTTCEIYKMVTAAIRANSLVGSSNFPQLKILALDSTATDLGSQGASLIPARNTKAEFVVSPFAGGPGTPTSDLRDHCALVSGANRPDNNQFGTLGFVANFSTAVGSLEQLDNQFMNGVYLRDTGSNAMSLGELAAAAAARIAANTVPFNPMDNMVIGGVVGPASAADRISVGAGLESETALTRGWTPLKVKANGEVAFVRTVTTRLTNTAGAAVAAYYDIQDFQVLFYWRKTLWTRINQPDFRNVKASVKTAQALKGEMIRLAGLFEDQGMFQSVKDLAKQFVVERSLTDRHRFDFKTPVNVIPGLHVIAGRIAAGTQFDAFSI